ncbi:MAG: hypothetical protein ABW212_01340, partial [Pseudonocardia sediminis]
GEQAGRPDGEQADGTVTHGPPPVGALPRRIAAVPTAPAPDAGGDDSGADRGDAGDDGPGRAAEPPLASARLQVVETTLHEVMTLLHRLAGPEKS